MARASSAGDGKVPTVEEALMAIDDWVREHQRVTRLMQQEIDNAKGTDDGQIPERGR